jgi:hypothetical protein
MQFHRAFDRRLMSEYVVVVNLAHALSEALINAAPAIGLAQTGAVELFGRLEKTDFKQKWLTVPKSINPHYTFPKGSALYETLTYLARQEECARTPQDRARDEWSDRARRFGLPSTGRSCGIEVAAALLQLAVRPCRLLVPRVAWRGRVV